jgi:hypothetical protein
MHIRRTLGMICLFGVCMVGARIPPIPGATPQGIAPGSVLLPLQRQAAGPEGPSWTLGQVGPSGGPSLTPTIPVIPAPQPTPQQGAGPAPAVQPPEARFECPKTRYIDCMPVIQGTQRPMCTKEYLEWAKAHCPDLQVVH